MDILKRNYQKIISSWIIFLFTCSTLSLLIYSEIFQKSIDQEDSNQFKTRLISSDIISNARTIKFKNRLGSFTVNRQDDGQWFLIEPRKMPAKEKTIETILENFENLSVRTIHQYEPLNLQSFSLDNPVMRLEIFTKLDEQIIFNIGLINPVNSTSYITLSNEKIIYQTDMFKNKLELLDLPDFINSNILDHDLDNIVRVEIFHGNQTTSYNLLENINGVWQSKRYKLIDNENVNTVINDILNVKTHMIIDSKKPEIVEVIQNYLKNPRYRVYIKQRDGKEVEYIISNIIGSITELKLDHKQYFIIMSSNRPYPHVIDKKYLENFLIQYKDIGPK